MCRGAERDERPHAVRHNDELATWSAQRRELFGEIKVITLPTINMAECPLRASVAAQIPGDHPPATLGEGAGGVGVAAQALADPVPEEQVATRAPDRLPDATVQEHAIARPKGIDSP